MTKHSFSSFSAFILLATTAIVGCGDDKRGSGDFRVDVGYDEPASQIQVILDRPVAEGEALHARVRQGGFGVLDCATMVDEIPRIDGSRVEADVPTYAGPEVEPSIFEPVLTAEWLEVDEPTPEMLAALEAGTHFIDICVMRDGKLVRQEEFDIHRALDRAGADGKYDGDEEDERIASVEAYADACVAKLGEIPFFPKVDDGDYLTYNCLDSVAIPTNVTQPDGTIVNPKEEVDACDEPQYLSPQKCEASARSGEVNGPRVMSATNEKGSSWVLLCRKAGEEEGVYNDIAMIGHNPYTGDTCFFQNALSQRNDGLHVPHPGDREESTDSPEKSPSLWRGLHGGVGTGISCASCHSTDPFIHTPWIDGAKFENGDAVIPKMGEHDNYVLGFNDSPYSIVNLSGQGWTMPKQLVSEEAAACTKCHRVADDRWADSWFDRMDGTSDSWNRKVNPEYMSFAHTFWMPPDLDGLDEESWDESEFAKAMDFIRNCASDNDADGCEWRDLPTDPIAEDGELPTIDLEGKELATEALIALGAPIKDEKCPDGDCENRRCSECHPISRFGVRNWNRFTQHAWKTCGLENDPEDMSQEQALEAVTCLKTDPKNPDSPYAAEHLGILTTGVQYNQFRKLFRQAFGDDAWIVEYTKFKARVSMPKGSHPKFSQREYAVVEKWFREDVTDLEAVLDEEPPPQMCVANADNAAITEHLEEMSFEGWGVVNAENGVRLFGCPDDGNNANCFADVSDANGNWGTGVGKLKELTKLDFTTSFWTRSSADGRFIGNGGGPEGATVTDLQTGENIGVDASYDPAFFPDNSGFMFQGATGGAGICDQSLLTSTDKVIDFTESSCITESGINLYQHVARGTNGGDYYVINSQFTSDSGSSNSDPAAAFAPNATMKFTPMVFDGAKYRALDEIVVESPYEGDSVLSPSGKLVVSRLAGPEGKGLGYVIRKVRTAVSGDNILIDINEEVATVCMEGAKVNISFDERFFVTHHYEDGVANIYMVDMVTMQQHKITDVPEGTKALFPHFTSSGWFNFLVRSPDGEFVVASDAALAIAAG